MINIMLSTLFASRRYAASQRKSRTPKSRRNHDPSRKKPLPFASAPPSSGPSASPGRYGDGYGGLGLSLLVTPRKSGGLSKTWAQTVSPNGTKTSLGLGSYPVVTLAMARDRALANARLVAEGRDPRRRMQQVPTFVQANETVIAIPHRELEERPKREPVARQHARLRSAASRTQARRRRDHRRRHGGAAADLVHQARDRPPGPPAHRRGDEVGRRARVPGRQPGGRRDLRGAAEDPRCASSTCAHCPMRRSARRSRA